MLNENLLNYTINTLISTLGIPPDIPVCYGDNYKENCIFIISGSDKDKDYKNFGKKIIQKPPDFEPLENKTPVLYDHLYLNLGVPIIHYMNKEVAVAYDPKKNSIVIGFDLIASAFYFLSVMEEETVYKRDEHNRYLASYGQLSSRFSSQPVVNDLQQVLFESVLYLYDKMNLPVIQKWYWPSQKDFAVCLTHDIDFIKPGVLYQIILPFKRLISLDPRGSFMALKRLLYRLYGKKVNPWDYNEILKLEESSGVKSTFFFIAGGHDKHDYPYDLNKEKSALIELRNSGFEVGLHGSYSSSSDINALADEMRILEETVGKLSGVRQHYLKFDKDTLPRQESAGFKYDSTLYYPDAPGFKGGLSYPFYPYNQITQKMMKILEIPLTVMDKTMLDYKKINAELAFNEIEKLIKTVEENNGLLTVLWHNEMYDEVAYPGWKRLYQRILTDLTQRDAWIVKAEDIYTWWTDRQKIICENTKITDKTIAWNYKSTCNVKDAAFRIHNLGDRKCTVKYHGIVDTDLGDGFLQITIMNLNKNDRFQFEVKR